MKKHLITIIIVCIACIACGFGAFLFYEKIHASQTEVATLQQEVQSLQIQADRLNTQKRENAENVKTAELDEYFVSANGALGFVEYIENLAVSSGLTYRINLFDSAQDPEASKNEKELLKTSLTTNGSVQNTRNFIALIQTLPYNVKITKVDLKRATDPSAAISAKDSWTAVIDFYVIKSIDKPADPNAAAQR